MKNKIILLTNFRSVFGNICIENLYELNIKSAVYVLKNNPYKLDQVKKKNKSFFSSFFKNKIQDGTLFFHDDTIQFLEECNINYNIENQFDINMFNKIVKEKPQAIILGDSPIITKDCVELAKKYNIPIINLHAAELPKYRGNYSTYAMVQDNQKLCMSYHIVNEKIDAGQIIGKYFLNSEILNEFDTFFTAERKLYIHGIEEFFKNLDKYISDIDDTNSSNMKYACVDVSTDDRDEIKLNFKKYLENVYKINMRSLSEAEYVNNILTKNTKSKQLNINNSKEIFEQLSLKFEDKFCENDKKYGLFHYNSSSIYKQTNIFNAPKINIKYPNNKKWCVILSHDVDIIPNSTEKIKKVFEIENKYNVSSTYLLASLKSLELRHEYDPTYILDDPMTKELIYYIAANNHEIGLHGSFNSYNDIKLLKEEKRRLEEFICMEVKSTRQHYLNFDKIQTPHIHHEAGFVIDSTLGFPTDVGIRTGYGAPFYFYDAQNKNNFQTLEIPYLIMDQNILWNERLENTTYTEKLEYFKNLLKKAKDNNIPVVLDWHLHTIEIDEWWDIYDNILRYLSDDNTCAMMNMEQFYYAYSLLN